MTIAAKEFGSRRRLRVFTGLMWFGVPAMAGLYAASWQELPAHLATHFDFANHPNGPAAREFHQIDRRLGVARALQHTAPFRAEGKDVPRLHQLLGHGRRVRHDLDRAGSSPVAKERAPGDRVQRRQLHGDFGLSVGGGVEGEVVAPDEGGVGEGDLGLGGDVAGEAGGVGGLQAGRAGI